MLNEFLRQVVEHPEDFSVDRHTWTHLPSGKSIWLANGFFSYAPYPGKASLLDKWRINKHYRWWLREGHPLARTGEQ